MVSVNKMLGSFIVVTSLSTMGAETDSALLQEYNNHIHTIERALEQFQTTLTTNCFLYQKFSTYLQQKKLSLTDFSMYLYITAECKDTVTLLQEAAQQLAAIKACTNKLRPFITIQNDGTTKTITKQKFLKQLEDVVTKTTHVLHSTQQQFQQFQQLCRQALRQGNRFNLKNAADQQLYQKFNTRWPGFYEYILTGLY